LCLALAVCDATASTIGLAVGPKIGGIMGPFEAAGLATYAVVICLFVFGGSEMIRDASSHVLWLLALSMSVDNLVVAANASLTDLGPAALIVPGLASAAMALLGYAVGLAARRCLHARVASAVALGLFVLRLAQY
jgi:putative Mn2+ efflux pump MntP